MHDIYGDWIFYGGLSAIFGIGLTVYIYGKIKGPDKLNWKVAFTIAIIFLVPCVILPFFLAPIMTFTEKIGFIVAVSVFVIVKYYLQTKAQEGMAVLRERKKNQKDEKD